jgi:hypothetical protein
MSPGFVVEVICFVTVHLDSKVMFKFEIISHHGKPDLQEFQHTSLARDFENKCENLNFILFENGEPEEVVHQMT